MAVSDPTALIWVDPTREFVAVVLMQVFWPPAGGADWLNAFRGEL